VMRDAKKDLEACERATPGPWETTGRHLEYIRNKNDFNVCMTRRSHDAEFIALARDALPYWIGRAQELEARLAKTERLLKKAGQGYINLIDLKALPHESWDDVAWGIAEDIDVFLREKPEPEKAEGCSFPGCGGGPDWCNAEDNGDCPGCGKAEDWSEEGQHDD